MFLLILAKMAWATIWAIFSQAHLVTLPGTQGGLLHFSTQLIKATGAIHFLLTQVNFFPRSSDREIFFFRQRS
jgi:hypothetical protein